MAKNKMTTCSACGHEIAKGKKVVCPKCGKVNKKPFYKRVWFIVLMVFVLIALVNTVTDDESSNSSSGSNTEVKEVENRTPLVVTADELIKALEDNALKAEQTYGDAYVEVTGKLSNIDSDGDYFSLTVMDGYTFTSIMCYITEEQKATVANFTSDQTVTVVGEITDIGEVLGYSIDVEIIK